MYRNILFPRSQIVLLVLQSRNTNFLLMTFNLVQMNTHKIKHTVRSEILLSQASAYILVIFNYVDNYSNFTLYFLVTVGYNLLLPSL